jgi:hypothetical protein
VPFPDQPLKRGTLVDRCHVRAIAIG